MLFRRIDEDWRADGFSWYFRWKEVRDIIQSMHNDVFLMSTGVFSHSKYAIA